MANKKTFYFQGEISHVYKEIVHFEITYKLKKHILLIFFKFTCFQLFQIKIKLHNMSSFDENSPITKLLDKIVIQNSYNKYFKRENKETAECHSCKSDESVKRELRVECSNLA